MLFLAVVINTCFYYYYYLFLLDKKVTAFRNLQSDID